MTFNQSTISSSSMHQKITDQLVGNFNEAVFETTPYYFHQVDDYFADFFHEKTINSSSFNINHVVYDDLYWESSYVNCDHSFNGILHLDFVYVPKGSEWGGCAATWDFDGAISVEGLIETSTNVRGIDLMGIKGKFDEKEEFFNQNEHGFSGHGEMAKKGVNSSSFTPYNNNLTVDMVKKSTSRSTFTKRLLNSSSSMTEGIIKADA